VGATIASLVEPYAATSHRQDAFSGAYIRAICAAAGCGVEAVTLDNDKIDYLVRSRVRGSVRSKPQIDFQAKCEMSGEATENPVPYSLDLETYDNLRDPGVCIPRVLLLIRVPRDVEMWLNQTENELRLNHCAYWLSLKGAPASENTTSQTVYFPRENVFGISALQSMMVRTANGRDI
jgi:hypothetical protein